jgi:hypothetical protein
LTSTDPTHTQPSDTTAGAATTDGSAGSTTMDHAMGSPNVTTADATAPSDTGTSGSPADSTPTDATHPATTVADGSTVGTATDHATGSPDVTTLASDTPPANVGTATPAADSTTTDMTHPGTTVADATGSTTLDHAASSPDITGDASTGATNGAGTSAAMTPDASEASASAGAGLTLHVSADSWNGAPQFQVFVDGKQAGDVHTATADHGAGQWEDVAINGDFGPGAHVVDVKFVNDGWNGTADTDRNLYVQSIAMNDATLAGNEAANDAHHGAWATDPSAAVMQINGDVEFHVPQSTTSGDLWAA